MNYAYRLARLSTISLTVGALYVSGNARAAANEEITIAKGKDPNAIVTLPNGQKAKLSEVVEFLNKAHRQSVESGGEGMIAQTGDAADDDDDDDKVAEANKQVAAGDNDDDDVAGATGAKPGASKRPASKSKKPLAFLSSATKAKINEAAKGAARDVRALAENESKGWADTVNKVTSPAKRAQAKKKAEQRAQKTPSKKPVTKVTPGKEPFNVKWSKHYGDDDMLSAFASIGIEGDATASDVTANGALEAGGFLLGKKHSLVKLTATAQVDEDAKGSEKNATGSIALYIGGNTTAVWKRDAEGAWKDFKKSLSTEKAEKKFTIAGMKVDVDIKGSGEIDLSEKITASGANSKFEIDLGIKPKILYRVTGAAKGNSKLAKVGISGNVELSNVTFPSNITLQLAKQGDDILLTEKLDARINGKFLAGSIGLYADIGSLGELGDSIVAAGEAIFGKKKGSSGKQGKHKLNLKIWSSKGFRYDNQSLLNKQRTQKFDDDGKP